jgi:hypothetical protein
MGIDVCINIVSVNHDFPHPFVPSEHVTVLLLLIHRSPYNENLFIVPFLKG